MKKYKIINSKTKEETICDKVTIDGFDYYVSDEKCIQGDLCYDIEGLPGHKNNKYVVQCLRTADDSYWNRNCKKIIATNNPNIDIPKVVDEVEKLAVEITDYAYFSDSSIDYASYYKGVKTGYNKHKETNSNSDEDMIKFCKIAFDKCLTGSVFENNKVELLELWKEQQPKIVYYGE